MASFLIAGVVVHLAAAGLTDGKDDSVAKTLQDTRTIALACLREERVVVAGNEQRDTQGASTLMPSTLSARDSIESIFPFRISVHVG